MRVATKPTPNVRLCDLPSQRILLSRPPDRYALERLAAGIEPMEGYHERSFSERVEFCLWWAVIGVGLGCVWYLVIMAVMLLLGGVR